MEEGSSRVSAEQMDEMRQKNIAYQYLCHLEEAKKWLEACIGEELPEAESFEEALRHGVYLAKLGNFFSQETVSTKKIFDSDLCRYRSYGLHFRHTDNINYFLRALSAIKLPKIFHPETTDIYDKKNIPKAIFCLHALSLYLFRLGIGPQIQNLYGRVKFSDEVVAEMMKELNKFGCQLPQFGRIGGILANELPIDEAALHAAIIAINDAITKNDMNELESTLLNPSSHLKNVFREYINCYMEILHDAQCEKKAIALDKSRDDSYIADAYDELLTQAEIQGFVNQTNSLTAVKRIEDAVREGREESLWNNLNHSSLKLKGLKLSCVNQYMSFLTEEIMSSGNESLNTSAVSCSLSRSSVQRVVDNANIFAEQEEKENLFMRQLNESLVSGTVGSTLETLQEMKKFWLGSLLDSAALLYHEELSAMRKEAQADLSLADVVSGVRFLTAVGRINAAVQNGHSEEIWECLCNPDAHVQDLDKSYDRDYAYRLRLYNDSNSSAQSTPLAYADIQECVDYVNERKNADNSKISALTALNEAVTARDSSMLLQILKLPFLGVENATGENISHFMDLLIQVKKMKKMEMQLSEDVGLWLEDLTDVSSLVLKHEEQARVLAGFLSALNWAVIQKAREKISNVIRSYNSSCFHVRADLIPAVVEKLMCLRETSDSYVCEGLWSKPFVTHVLNDKYVLYVDVQRGEFSWTCPTRFDATSCEDTMTQGGVARSQGGTTGNQGGSTGSQGASTENQSGGTGIQGGSTGSQGASTGNQGGLVSMEEFCSLIQSVNEEFTLSQKLERQIICFQAVCRGFVVRARLQKIRKNAVVIQSWWRMVRVQRSFMMYMKALRMWEPQIIKIQRAFRAWRNRKRMLSLSDHFKQNEAKVKVIQRAWRQYKARQDLHAITHCKDPNFNVVCKFVHLLQVTHFDFEEEIRLQGIKSDVVKTIRRSQDLESRIDELDVKIGLLVHNKITLQEIIKPTSDKENSNPNRGNTEFSSATKKFKKGHRKEIDLSCSTLRSQRGLKALTKESRNRLLGYQHLFYLLQTQPHYLASLIFALPFGKTTKIIENVIFALYNYGANDRDNFLLIKLFRTAFEEEIRNRVLRMSEIVSGNPLVIKMIVSFNRKGAGQSSLRDLLSPLVNRVLADTTLQISTNPVEIYKIWVNHLEMTTGKPSGLPYSVDQDQALQYPEVKNRLMKAMNALREITSHFCNHITSSRHLIPYNMQYMAKVMKAALHNRFPHVHEKEILKVVGNLIYYRFINSAIVAPDAFDIVTLPPEKKLTNDQRRNLASIAKILQFGATKKGFGKEASHLMGLNSFIIECHEKFKSFFQECCLVDEPEDVYNMNQFSEVTLIIKPTVYLTLQEIIQTHELLLNNEDVIAPDSDDPLHELLRDLGDKKPSVFTLIGEIDGLKSIGSESLCGLGRAEVCLALSGKHDFHSDSLDQKNSSKDSNEKLFSRTKQLLIDVMQCIDPSAISSIGDLITCPTVPEQEKRYQILVSTRGEREHRARLNETGLNRSNSFLGGGRVSLSEVKTRLSHNLRRLENRALVTRSNNYQSLLNAVAQEIVNQKQRRVSRRAELQKLLITLHKLENKERFYDEQLKSYNTYLHVCLDNLASKNKNVHVQAISGKSGKVSKNKLTIKYTGARLHERGVILEIEDLPSVQLKNVLFEICPLPTPGQFEVQVKFMGVGMEVVQLNIQDLLQLQYEGISVKTMFGKAKVNVNLLLHLLNSKFYSKK